jgi:hypothetical protein
MNTQPRWGIWDRGRRLYVDVTWPTREQALWEMEDLLAPYPPGHEWRKRLQIACERPMAAWRAASTMQPADVERQLDASP